MIVEDVMETYWHILVGLILAMIACLILIAIMRWMATPLVWLSIIGVITMLGFGEFYDLFSPIWLISTLITLFLLQAHIFVSKNSFIYEIDHLPM